MKRNHPTIQMFSHTAVFNVLFARTRTVSRSHHFTHITIHQANVKGISSGEREVRRRRIHRQKNGHMMYCMVLQEKPSFFLTKTNGNSTLTMPFLFLYRIQLDNHQSMLKNSKKLSHRTRKRKVTIKQPVTPEGLLTPPG